MAHCLLFKHDMFVWVDETGANNRDHIRNMVMLCISWVGCYFSHLIVPI